MSGDDTLKLVRVYYARRPGMGSSHIYPLVNGLPLIKMKSDTKRAQVVVEALASVLAYATFGCGSTDALVAFATPSITAAGLGPEWMEALRAWLEALAGFETWRRQEPGLKAGLFKPLIVKSDGRGGWINAELTESDYMAEVRVSRFVGYHPWSGARDPSLPARLLGRPPLSREKKDPNLPPARLGRPPMSIAEKEERKAAREAHVKAIADLKTEAEAMSAEKKAEIDKFETPYRNELEIALAQAPERRVINEKWDGKLAEIYGRLTRLEGD